MRSGWQSTASNLWPSPPARSEELASPVVVGVPSAFLGALVGRRLIRKVTLRAAQMTVPLAMLCVDGTLIAGPV